MSVCIIETKEIDFIYNALKFTHNKLKFDFTNTISYKDWIRIFKEPEITNQALLSYCVQSMHVSNVTAYNVQYRENAEIDFTFLDKMDSETELKNPKGLNDIEIIAILKDSISSLQYNMATNGGVVYFHRPYYEVLTVITTTCKAFLEQGKQSGNELSFFEYSKK